MLLQSIKNRISKYEENTKVIVKNSFYAFIIKGISLTLSFISTPYFIKYFNDNEVLGVWYTLLSVLTWFLTFDFGIGNGIRNHLVEAITINDRRKIKNILSSGIASVLSVTILIGIIGFYIITKLNLNEIFNVSIELIGTKTLKISTYCVFLAILIRFVLTIISSIFYALQKSAVNNFISLCVSILLLLYILCFHFENVEEGLLNISIAYLILANLPLLIAGIYVFFFDLKDCMPNLKNITWDCTRKIMGIGGIYFFCQIFYMVIANTNEFFVSHFWNPLYAADYGFYYRIIMLLSMIVSLGLTPTWSMITKAYTECNYIWLKKLYKTLKLIGLIVIVLQFAMIPFLQRIMDIWLGKNQLIVHLDTSIAFACFGATFLYSTMLSTIVCGLAKMKLQFYCYGLGAIFKIIFIINLSHIENDWTWVVWSNVFILLIYCILQQIQLNILFNKLLKNG